VVGVNGAGKTTLLNLLRGDLEPTSGRVRRGKTVKVATLSQDTHELDDLGDMRVVEAVADVAQTMVIDGREVSASQLTERMGFTRQRAWTRISEISGGERRRLQLMRLLMSEPNVLLLDEPTNDLDIDTLAAMEDLLDSFPGTLVVVSHDRYLLERVTDHQVALLGDGTVRALPGGVEQYLRLREAGAGAAPSSSGRDEDGGGQAARNGSAATSNAAGRRAAKKEADRVQRRLEKLRTRASAVEEELAQVSQTLDGAPRQVQRLTELSEELRALEEQVDQAETEWLEAAERAEL
jgi:ABC-type multidrug transport system ATPase subunit